MYYFLLASHSLIRWVVIISIITAIVRSFIGWKGNKAFTPNDNKLRLLTVTATHIQAIIGAILYIISPLISYFLHNFSEAVGQRQVRFFGMEHSSMMLLSVVLLTIGSAKAKRKTTDAEKFRTMAIWFTIAFLVMLSSIPWWFSPLTARPMLRPF